MKATVMLDKSWETKVFQVTSFHVNYGCPTNTEEQGSYQVNDHVSCKQIDLELFVFYFLNMGTLFRE